MNVPPALEHDAFRVGPNEEELLEILVLDRSDVGRAGDMRLAGVAEFEFGALFLAIGAAYEKHGSPFLGFFV